MRGRRRHLLAQFKTFVTSYVLYPTLAPKLRKSQISSGVDITSAFRSRLALDSLRGGQRTTTGDFRVIRAPVGDLKGGQKCRLLSPVSGEHLRAIHVILQICQLSRGSHEGSR
jgi:hypothetical protein